VFPEDDDASDRGTRQTMTIEHCVDGCFWLES
jgi:hypothetical protein